MRVNKLFSADQGTAGDLILEITPTVGDEQFRARLVKE